MSERPMISPIYIQHIRGCRIQALTTASQLLILISCWTLMKCGHAHLSGQVRKAGVEQRLELRLDGLQRTLVCSIEATQAHVHAVLGGERRVSANLDLSRGKVLREVAEHLTQRLRLQHSGTVDVSVEESRHLHRLKLKLSHYARWSRSIRTPCGGYT